jgi:hypothetical protein
VTAVRVGHSDPKNQRLQSFPSLGFREKIQPSHSSFSGFNFLTNNPKLNVLVVGTSNPLGFNSSFSDSSSLLHSDHPPPPFQISPALALGHKWGRE